MHPASWPTVVLENSVFALPCTDIFFLSVETEVHQGRVLHLELIMLVYHSSKSRLLLFLLYGTLFSERAFDLA